MAMFVVDGVIAKNTAQEYGPWSMRRLHTFFEASMGDSIKLQRLTKLFPNAVRVFNQMLSAIIKNAEPYDREQRERAIWEER